MEATRGRKCRRHEYVDFGGKVEIGHSKPERNLLKLRSQEADQSQHGGGGSAEEPGRSEGRKIFAQWTRNLSESHCPVATRGG